MCKLLRPQSSEIIALHRNDLANLFQLGHRRARQLALVGIESCDDLLTVGVDEMVERLRGHGWGIGRFHIESWIAHAQAWAANAPVFFGDPPPMPTDYVAFDLEYLPQGGIWLAGMRPVGGELTQFWTWDPAGEPDLIQSTAAYWAARPDARIATWWGKGADMPALRRASERTGVEVGMEPDRHFDLCHWAMRHLRLPTRYLSLKDVAAYFGVLDSDHGIRSGDEAVDIYLQAVQARRKKAKARARVRLEAYNAEDVDAVIRLIELLRTKYPQVPREHRAPPRRVKGTPAIVPKQPWMEIVPAGPRDLDDPQTWTD